MNSVPASQVGALCQRDDGQVLLITSRRRRRWIIPKGWAMPDRTEAAAALLEAWEEAGVEGAVDPRSIGRYHYQKLYGNGATRPIEVRVFAVTVTRLVDEFREAGQRRRRWCSPIEAAGLVAEPGLQQILRRLPAPDRLATGPNLRPEPAAPSAHQPRKPDDSGQFPQPGRWPFRGCRTT